MRPQAGRAGKHRGRVGAGRQHWLDRPLCHHGGLFGGGRREPHDQSGQISRAVLPISVRLDSQTGERALRADGRGHSAITAGLAYRYRGQRPAHRRKLLSAAPVLGEQTLDLGLMVGHAAATSFATTGTFPVTQSPAKQSAERPLDG